MDELRLEAQDLNQQAALLIKAGNLEMAKSKLDKAIDTDPMLMDSYKNYGDLYMAAQQYKDAKNYYKKALLVEKVPELYFLCGNACFMADELHEGLDYYNQAITAGFDSDEMIFFMGLAYEHLNDDRMALRYFQKAAAKNPSRPDYLVKKISVLVRLDMLESAETEVEVLLRTAPELFDGYHMKTQLLIHGGRYAEAATFAKTATEKFPEDADLMYDYIHAVAMTKDFGKALKLLESAKQMKYFGESIRKFLLLEAQVAAESNDYGRAMSCCKECIATENESFFAAESRFMLMNMLLAKPDFDAALIQAEQLIKNDAEDSFYFAALYYKATFLKKLGQEEEAAVAYKEANAIYRLATLKNPAAIDVYLYRAMCLKDMENYDKALEILDFILGLNTEVAEVYAIKADIYTALGRHAQAEEQKEKAYALKPELRPVDPKDGE